MQQAQISEPKVEALWNKSLSSNQNQKIVIYYPSIFSIFSYLVQINGGEI